LIQLLEQTLYWGDYIMLHKLWQPRLRWALLAVLILGLVSVVVGSASADDGTEIGATHAAFQQYYGGYMVWRADTGGIWVFINSGWTARYFPEAEYRNLPDNPTTETPPEGYTRPIRGFGRVWGNFPEVAAQLGWAIGEERGYDTTFEQVSPTAGGLQQVAVTLPIMARLVIREDGTWGYISQVRPISSLPSSTTMPAAWQAFERGYMMYWPETGSIWVLYDSGQTEYFASNIYGWRSENPITARPPTGHFSPILGFGKVWGNFAQVRRGLGWAIAGEQGYTTTFDRVLSGSSVLLLVQAPSGLAVTLRDNDTWYMDARG
jgi:hypothetical protein